MWFLPPTRPSRRLVYFQAAAAAFVILVIALTSKIYANVSSGLPLYTFRTFDRLPPLYSRFHAYELQLPQHDRNSTKETQEVKYLWIANHVRGVGWGNVMQELLLNHYLAYRAGRSFVFNNFTWDESDAPYSYFNAFSGMPIPSRIPLSAIIRGPTVGASMTSDSQTPLAVKKEYWDEICPNPKTISNADIIASFDRPPTAKMLIERWAEVLRSTEDRCVETAKDASQIFDSYIFGYPERLLDVWPTFSESPIMTELGWSSLVELAFDQNRETFAPTATIEPYLTSTQIMSNAERYPIISGLLVIHVRRGDFDEHCKRLIHWGSGYVAYNSFPQLSDRLEVPSDADEQLKTAIYWPHCFPGIAEIARKIDEVRRSSAGQGLRHIYIMTNGPSAWVHELKTTISGIAHWDTISSSRDLAFNDEQEYVKQAVDMLIGQRAQVFIGNGFSSLTGQVVMLRMANGVDPSRNRFF